MNDSKKSTTPDSNITTRRRGVTNAGKLLLITISLYVILYVLSIILFKQSNFAKFSVFFNMFNNKAYLLMLALGLTVVIITGGIDISVGRVTGLVSMAIAVMLLANGNDSVWSAILAIPLALGIGLAFGVVQGILVSYMNIQPFIVTLTGLFFAQGMISVLNTGSVPITNTTFLSWSSAKLYIPFLYNVRNSGTHDVAYFTPAAIVAILVLIVVIIVMKKTRFGRSLYAIGGNPQSALLMGINVKRTRFLAYALSGLLAGIGGLLYTLFAPQGNPGNGYGYEIDAIAAAVIGGAMLTGGMGLPIGTLFGVLFYALIERIVPMLGIVDASWPRVITSAFLFAFIVIQSILVSTSKRGGLKGLLPAWMRSRSKNMEAT